MFGRDELEEALETLGAVLESRQLSSRILVAGGSSLLLLGLIDRPTADLDVIGLAGSGDRPLEVHVTGRFDLVCFKLYAAVDHSGYQTSKHLADLKGLDPTVGELEFAARWTRTQDPSEGFEGELIKILATLGVGNADAEL
jgi:hypothetical protein